MLKRGKEDKMQIMENPKKTEPRTNATIIIQGNVLEIFFKKCEIT